MYLDPDKQNDRLTVHFTMELKPTQALAVMAMFKYWNILSSMGGSREVGFFVDGDGDFHPNVHFGVEGGNDQLPPLTDELFELAIAQDNHGDRLFDFDALSWKLYHEDDNG